jgi:hypothetical protein
LYLAVDLAQGQTGPPRRHGCVPLVQPSTDSGTRRCLKPAHCAAEFYDSAHHAMDFDDCLVVNSIEPEDAVNLFGHALSIQQYLIGYVGQGRKTSGPAPDGCVRGLCSVGGLASVVTEGKVAMRALTWRGRTANPVFATRTPEESDGPSDHQTLSTMIPNVRGRDIVIGSVGSSINGDDVVTVSVHRHIQQTILSDRR